MKLYDLDADPIHIKKNGAYDRISRSKFLS